MAWDYLAGGSEEEASLRDNLAGYQKIILRPKVLTGVGKIDTSLELFGLKLDYPILLDPTGCKSWWGRWLRRRPTSGGKIAQLVAVLLAELAEGPIPKLADPFAGDAQHPADLF